MKRPTSPHPIRTLDATYLATITGGIDRLQQQDDASLSSRGGKNLLAHELTHTGQG